MSVHDWTADQREAVTAAMKSLLVSAAAGSGKTSVLADRCVWLVCDAPQPCNVDELLVVTFTRAAASEMRDRINARIRQRAEQSRDPRIEHQLRVIDRATISTLDSFCAALVREHFVAAAVDPDFVVLDEDEARLLRLEAGQATLDSFFHGDREDELHQLLRIHFSSDESELIESISHIHNVLTSTVDPKTWLDRQRERLEDPQAIEQGIADFYQPLRSILPGLITRARSALPMARTDARFIKYADYATDVENFCATLIRFIDANKFEEAVAYARENRPSVEFRTGPRNDVRKQITRLLQEIKCTLADDGDAGCIIAHAPSALRASVVECAPRMRLFIDLVRDFESRYSAAKRAVSSLDFADLNRATLSLLQSRDHPTQPSQLARSLHARYRHVLVDECQDINPIQDAILRLLSTETLSHSNLECVSNLFSVGDVKQSIYGFRLANPAQFIERSDELEALKITSPDRGALILLRENFRSRGPLLDAVNRIFERLMTRESAGIDYDEKHALRQGREYAVAPDGFTGRPIELHVIEAERSDEHETHDNDEDTELDASETEAHLIANRIHQLLGNLDRPRAMVLDEKDTTRRSHRPIEPGDIAILLRSARGTAAALAGDLRARGVRVHLENASGFFQAIEVLDVLSLLQVADNSTRDIPLAALIRSPFSRISEPESLMARIRLADRDVPFHQAVHRHRDVEPLGGLFDQIEKWRAMLRNERLDRAIERIVNDGYLNWLSGLPDGAQRIANVQELIRRARAFSAFERQSVSRFIQFLGELEGERDLDLPSAASQSRETVRIMTVHKSKGLEFPVVIVPDLGRKRNVRSLHAPVLIDRVAGLGIKAYEAARHVRYPSLFYRLASRAIDQQEIAEELRILYVALTRAKEHLILIGTGGKVEDWRERWQDHTGPLPAGEIRSACTMLNRLGPAAVMIERDTPGNISIQTHSPSEIASLPPPLAPTNAPDSLKKLARFDPIDSAGTAPAPLREIFHQFQRPYRFEGLTEMPSARAVTQIKMSTATRAARLAHPHFTSDSQNLSAAERGTATHAVFQHIDYRKLSSAEQIRAQIQTLIERRLLSSTQASHVDIESLLWFGQTDLCRAMTTDGAKLLREMPVYLARPGGLMQSPMDQVLLRGRIDVALIDASGQATVIDFKTDRIDESKLEDRAYGYRSQMVIYCEAISSLSGRPTTAKLVFLHTKQVVDV